MKIVVAKMMARTKRAMVSGANCRATRKLQHAVGEIAETARDAATGKHV